MRNKAFIFPGQGAQKPYMGKTFYDSFLESKEVFQEAEDFLSLSITSKVFSSDEAFLKETDFCQVALFVTSMAILKGMETQADDIVPHVTAGLSLGEFSALCAAKKANFLDLLPVIKQRGILMKKASEKSPGSMVAVLGLSEESIPKKYQIANINHPTQIILAGTTEEMVAAREELKKLGARKVVPLKVSGAFHSTHMESARLQLSPYILGCKMHPSLTQYVMNLHGKVVWDMDEIKETLSLQMVKGTRWVSCVAEMEKMDVDYIELGPSQLTTINKRNTIKGASQCIEEVKDLESLYETV